MQSEKAQVYLCKYTYYETPFSRHFISGVANCIEWGSIGLDELRKILAVEHYEVLMREGQVILTEPRYYGALTGQEYSGREYIVLKLIKK
ncbi:hypothetical protein IMZ38_00070 [Thermosphaera chiliense]|uniref:Uncharacterized protein n=1 Tax=Thermosphaera chiliense TaxID=3402707 RepID=A0A7M1UQ79_9CREN|nr:hypothetical protein [Thermosphaera aggregans]QOR94405.1 hypothetical protein IMZ38_00070 [Thermosphaera aggregans]